MSSLPRHWVSRHRPSVAAGLDASETAAVDPRTLNRAPPKAYACAEVGCLVHGGTRLGGTVPIPKTTWRTPYETSDSDEASDSRMVLDVSCAFYFNRVCHCVACQRRGTGTHRRARARPHGARRVRRRHRAIPAGGLGRSHDHDRSFHRDLGASVATTDRRIGRIAVGRLPPWKPRHLRNLQLLSRKLRSLHSIAERTPHRRSHRLYVLWHLSARGGGQPSRRVRLCGDAEPRRLWLSRGTTCFARLPGRLDQCQPGDHRRTAAGLRHSHEPLHRRSRLEPRACPSGAQTPRVSQSLEPRSGADAE